MDDCQCVILKEINVFLSLIICPIVNNLINTSTSRKRNKYHGYKFKNYFSEKKLPLTENLRIKS